MKNILIFLIALPAFFRSARADWTQWRGPNHDGVSKETAWNAQWQGEPKRLWSAKVGEGFSSMTVAQGRLYTLGRAGKTETVHCLDANSGRVLWTHGWPSQFKAKYYEGGTSSTPVVDGNAVYVFGQSGELVALTAAAGKVLWQKNLADELRLKSGTWGFAGSPLVDGERLILNAGTHGTTVNKATGKVLWQSGTSETGYATPVPFSSGGRALAALMGKEHVFAVERATGKLAWKHPWKTNYDVNAADPILLNGQMLISSGYGHGAALLALSNSGATEVWQNTKLRSQMNPGIALGGYVYAFDGHSDSKPALVCLNIATGQPTWRQEGLGLGTVIGAGGKLIILSEKGELITAEANPRAFTPISRAQVLGGKCWTVPTLANGLLYARNWKGDLVCLDLRK
jgi:outer membrane protein assembly factor BamB